MELRRLFAVLRRRWIALALVTEIAIMLGLATTLLTTPEFQSTTRIFVGNPGTGNGQPNAYQDSMFSRLRISSYATVVTGEQLALAVVDRLDLPMTADELQSRVSARAVPETVLLAITVTDADPALARRLADAVTAEFLRIVPGMEHAEGVGPQVRLSVVEPATVPTSPVRPRPVRTVVTSVILGLVAGAAVAVIRDTLDTTLRSVAQLRQVAGPVLGEIPTDRRARTTPLLHQPATDRDRAEAYRLLRAGLHVPAPENEALRSLVVTGAERGAGTSTLAVNLALAFAETGERVVLLEGDLRTPSVLRLLSLPEGPGLSDVLAGRWPLAEALHPWGHSLRVLGAGSTALNTVELLSPRRLAPVLRQLEAEADLVLIDGPPLLDAADGTLLAGQVDGALLVIRHGRTRQDRLEECLETLSRADTPLVGTVLSLAPAATPLSRRRAGSRPRATALPMPPGPLRAVPLPRDPGALAASGVVPRADLLPHESEGGLR